MAWEWLGPAATAVVGVAGITGTVVGAALARRAQVDVARMGPMQALIAEKRQVYAKFLRSAEDLLDAAVQTRALLVDVQRLNQATEDTTGMGKDEREAAAEEVTVLQNRLSRLLEKVDEGGLETMRLRSELLVLGGPLIGSLASGAMNAIMDYANGNGDRHQAVALSTELAVAMHGDTDPNAVLGGR